MSNILLLTDLGSDWFEFSTIGNTHYGYVGRAAGFTASELYIGAGYAQFQDDRTTISKGRPLVGNRSSSSYWDTEDDHAAVKLGVSMYDLYGDNIDETKFTALLTSYSSAMAREAPQGTTSAQRDASLEYDGDFFNGPFSPPANDND
jgi:hypothetical protein